MVGKTLKAEETRPARSGARFLFHGVLRRIPGYAFFVVHLCFIHILWGQLVDQFFNSALTFADTNASKRDLAADTAVRMYHGIRHSVDQTLLHGLTDVFRTRRGTGFAGAVAASRACGAFLWMSPSSMVLFFGLAFLFSNALLAAARICTAFLGSLTAPCRGRRTLERGGSRRPVPVHITVRYGNGYDSVLRFALAAVELTWFLSYPVLNSPSLVAGGVDQKGGRAAAAVAGAEPTYASLRQLQARQQAIASFQIEASLLLPPQLFDSTAEAVAAGRFVLLFVKLVLGFVVALDAQRLFHAIVGVRPLFVPNGWERCPVCGALWKRSRKAASALHLCPIVLSATPLTADTPDDSGSSDEDSPRRQRLAAPPAQHPGDAFPDPNTASFAALVTDSWISPVLNFTLLAPLNIFAPSPLSSIHDDGRGHWLALLRVVDRLPRLARSLRTRERIADPAWSLWQRRHEPPTADEVGWLERSFMAVTRPVRRILSRAFAVFFLPPSARSSSRHPGEFGPPRTGAALFRTFLRHPSGREFVFVCVPLKLTQDLLSLLAPRVVKALVTFLKEVSVSNAMVRHTFLGRGLLICLSLILAVSLQALFFQLYLTHLYASCVKATSALKTLLLRQSLTTPLAYTGGGKARAGSAAAAATAPGSPASPQSPARSHDKGGKTEVAASPTAKAAPEASAPAPATTSATLSREGGVMALLTVDTTNCGDCIIFLHNVWGHPFVIVSSLMSMYSYVGLFSTLATFAALVALIPLNRSSAARVRTAQQHAKNSESRLSDLTAALSTMRTVKSMALEECLVGRIEEVRVRESEGITRVGRAESVAAAQTEVTTLLVALVCCGSYLLTGGTMDAAVLVPTMAALQVMRFPVWTLPHLYSQVSRGYTSLLRIEHYLTEQEAGESASAAYVQHRDGVPRGTGGADGEATQQPVATAAAAEPSRAVAPQAVRRGEVRCVRGTFAWNTQAAVAEQMAHGAAPTFSAALRPPPTGAGSGATAEEATGSPFSSTFSSPRQGSSRSVVLRDVDVDVSAGEFVVVHGATGCGKSALLLAMLGELYKLPTDGSPSAGAGFQVGGRVVYCAEVPWLRQGTVRENIRLVADDAPESSTEREWYERVLEACALHTDVKALAKGDRTMVGEGGSKLSGGQRARVALARAVYRYSETDVFIFDDVLSALDVEVQKHIIAHLFHGLLCFTASDAVATAPRRAKTIILATHVAVGLLMPDRVLSIWPDGTLHEDSTHRAPAVEAVLQQKIAWRTAAAAAAEAKDQRRAVEHDAAAAQRGDTSPGTAALPPAVHGSPKARPAAPPLAAAGINSLLPRAADLHRLFVEYIGSGRLLWCLALSVVMQLFRTLMDNWLGVYISLYDKRKAAFETILRSTKSQRARKVMLDVLSLVVTRGDKTTAAPQAPPPAPAAPLMTVLGVPIAWHNPFVLDTVAAQFLGTYAFIGFSAALLSMLRTDFFFRSYQRMADALQLHAVRKLFKAPVSYFDRIPSSRLLQILSRDQEVVDRALGESVQLIFLTVLQLLGMVCFNAFHFGPFIAVLPISALLFYHLTVRFLSFTKQVRALESVLQSRALAVIKDAVNGAVTVRAFGAVMKEQLVREMNEALDAVHVAANAGLTADRWVALRLEFVALAFTSALALLSVMTVCLSPTASAGSAAFAGLGIISSMTASRSLSMLCRRFGMFQNQFVSAEQLLRLEEEIPAETAPAAADSTTDDEPTQSGQEGSAAKAEAAEIGVHPLLDVRHLCAKYQPQLPWVLTDICFALRQGECVGLIGRTGNGKSSLFNALLGLMDVVEGEVLVPAQLLTPPAPHHAAVNALGLPQHALRKHYFHLVSQEPFLLQGTCRSNLLLGYDGATGGDAAALDVRLCEVLRKVALDELLAPSQSESDGAQELAGDSAALPCGSSVDAAVRVLDHPVTAGGSNLSAGQRQLLCLARAILHRPRVVLLDEVSSRVDRRTDDLIQRVIKEEMLGRSGAGAARDGIKSGVLLIAHRLETIISLCDSVVVVEKGRCVAHLSKEQASSLEDLESFL